MKKVIYIVPVFIFLLFSSVLADIITLKDSTKVIIGKVIKETETDLIVKEKGGGISQFPKAWVKKIKKSEIPKDELYTVRDIYFQRLEKVLPDDADGQLELGLWCFSNQLLEFSEVHLKLAVSLNPKLNKDVEKKLTIIENLKTEKMLMDAQSLAKSGNFLTAERIIFNLLTDYPDSGHTCLAEDLLVKIWGEKKAKKLMKKKDKLPGVALHPRQIPGILNYLKTGRSKRAYLRKCLNKAMNFEERAEEITDKETKLVYVKSAINCYYLVLFADFGNIDMKNFAHLRIENLSKRYKLSEDEKGFLIERR